MAPARLPRRTWTDEYERRFMGAERALYRERVRMSAWGHALFAGLLVLIVRDHGSVPSRLVALGILSAVWTLLLVLRVVVTDRVIHVQLGTFGPKIPLRDIVTIRAERKSALLLGGYGFRFGLSGVLTFNVPASTNQYVLVEYRRGGRVRRIRFMSHDAARVVATVQRALAEQRILEQVAAMGGLPDDVHVLELAEPVLPGARTRPPLAVSSPLGSSDAEALAVAPATDPPIDAAPPTPRIGR